MRKRAVYSCRTLKNELYECYKKLRRCFDPGLQKPFNPAVRLYGALVVLTMSTVSIMSITFPRWTPEVAFASYEIMALSFSPEPLMETPVRRIDVRSVPVSPRTVPVTLGPNSPDKIIAALAMLVYDCWAL